jgi:hypothetical protein
MQQTIGKRLEAKKIPDGELRLECAYHEGTIKHYSITSGRAVSEGTLETAGENPAWDTITRPFLTDHPDFGSIVFTLRYAGSHLAGYSYTRCDRYQEEKTA